MKRAFLFAVALAAAGACRADDQSAGAAFPPLTVESPKPVARPLVATVQLDGDQVQVRLALDPRSRAPARLALTWPAYGWLGASEPYPVRHAPELRVLVDEQPVTLENEVDAYVGGTRVTPLLQRARLDPWAITDSPPFVSPAAEAGDSVNALVSIGALSKDEGHFIARWSAERRAQFTVPARATALSLAYKALPAFAMLEAGAVPPEALAQAVCVAPARFKAVLRDKAWVAKTYVLPVGISGQAPAIVQLQAEHLGAGAWLAVCSAQSRGTGALVQATVPSFKVSAGRDANLRVLVLTPLVSP